MYLVICLLILTKKNNNAKRRYGCFDDMSVECGVAQFMTIFFHKTRSQRICTYVSLDLPPSHFLFNCCVTFALSCEICFREILKNLNVDDASDCGKRESVSCSIFDVIHDWAIINENLCEYFEMKWFSKTLFTVHLCRARLWKKRRSSKKRFLFNLTFGQRGKKWYEEA
jgi:hypothetical protein